MLPNDRGQTNSLTISHSARAIVSGRSLGSRMFIGILQFELIVHGSTSLKDKRRVVRSLKDRLHRDRLVSVAEVDALDEHGRAVLGVTLTANTAARAKEVLDAITNELHRLGDAELGRIQRDIIKSEPLPEHADLSEASFSYSQEIREQVNDLLREDNR